MRVNTKTTVITGLMLALATFSWRIDLCLDKS